MQEVAERDYEAEAKPLGWVPKDEYRGDTDNWRDAKEFVEHGEKILPVLRDNFRTLKDEYGKTKAEVERLTASLDKLSEYHKKTAERAQERAEKKYAAEIKRLKTEQASAVQDGDVAAYQQLETEREDLEANKPEKAEEGGPAPEFEEFLAANSWYNSDQGLTEEADFIGYRYKQQHPRIGAKRLYEHVAKTIRERHKDKFENPKRKEAAAVGSGDNDAGPTGKGKHTYANLPPEAKKACDEFVADGVLTKEQYVKEYEWEE